MKSSQITVSTWPELHEVLYADSWNPALRRHRSPYVFRGQGRGSAPLTTSLQRQGGDTRAIEGHLLRNFRKYAHRSGIDRDLAWYWLAVGQHHGLPTRLLDWTSSPLVALHFATAEEDLYGEDGVVWMTNFERTNATLPAPLAALLEQEGAGVFTVDMLAAFSRAREPLATVPTSAAFELNWLEDLEREAEQPFLLFLEPPSLDERIVQQAALFSLLSTPDLALDEWLAGHPGSARKVILPAEFKWEIRDKLDQSNITERTLFPGLGGWARPCNATTASAGRAGARGTRWRNRRRSCGSGAEGLGLVHVKFLQPRRLAVLGFHRRHAGMGRTAPQPVKQAGQGLFRPFGDHLHPAVEEVLGTARQAEVAGVPLHVAAVAHPLHGAGNESGQTHGDDASPPRGAAGRRKCRS